MLRYCGSLLKKLCLASERVGRVLVGVDIPLRGVHNEKAQLERVQEPREHVKRVRVCIHQVRPGEDADRPPALKVDGPRELEIVRAGEDSSCRGDGKNGDDVCVRVCVRVCTCGR